jgi:hypothetical protein
MLCLERVSDSATRRAIEAAFRIESARLLARIVRDVGVAEELAQDPLVAALAQWPATGVPTNPGAWLMTTAKHHAINHVRRQQIVGAQARELGAGAGERERRRRGAGARRRRGRAAAPGVHRLSPRAGRRGARGADPAPARRPLHRRAGARLPGLGANRGAAVGAREANPAGRARAVEVPRVADRTARLDSVLATIYLVFNEGYAATAGEDWMRPELCRDAIRLGRILAELMPAEPEVRGLIALMELHASRTTARVDRSHSENRSAIMACSRQKSAASSPGLAHTVLRGRRGRACATSR